jgi:hypothetical protein
LSVTGPAGSRVNPEAAVTGLTPPAAVSPSVGVTNETAASGTAGENGTATFGPASDLSGVGVEVLAVDERPTGATTATLAPPMRKSP